MEGGGNCSLCGSPHTTKRTCPLNPKAKNKNKTKHFKAKKGVKFASTRKVKRYRPYTKAEKEALYITSKEEKEVKKRVYSERENCPKGSHYDKAACPYRSKRCFNPDKQTCESDVELSSPTVLRALSPESADDQYYWTSKRGRKRSVLNANEDWSL